MKFDPPLKSATLIRRYKRFLADVTLDKVLNDESEFFTLHCANTGAMTGCATPGDTIYYSTSDNPKRKYTRSWQLTQTQAGHWICVNTAQANALVEEAIHNGTIAELQGYSHLKREVKYGEENSRIDIKLYDDELAINKKADCYVEVKSVTLLGRDDTTRQQGQGYFPDAVTSRGQKHLRELRSMVESGHRAVLLFAVLHTGIEQFNVARHIDKTYAKLFDDVRAAGVEIICYRAQITENEMKLVDKLEVNHVNN